jgi:ribosome-binding protein aMBF1 (putative translation factor)
VSGRGGWAGVGLHYAGCRAGVRTTRRRGRKEWKRPVRGWRRRRAWIELGLQFRDARVAMGRSQRDLSEASGVRQADISRIERGAGNPTEATLHRLALALGKRLQLA